MRVPYCGSNINVDVALLWIGLGAKLTKNRCVVFGIYYEGHEHPMEAHCYVEKFENIINHCSGFFKSVCGKLNSSSDY